MTRARTLRIHGRRIAYRRGGDGPALLLIHGMAGEADNWREVVEPLARDHTVIVPDLPGHGRSEPGHGDYSLGGLAASLRDLLVAIGVDRVTLVGHSLGGGIAMQFAYQFPERAERLALVSSGGLGPEVSAILRAAALPGSELVIGGTAGIVGAVARGLDVLRLRPSADLAEVLRGYGALGDHARREAFLATLRSVVDPRGQRVDASSRLHLAEEIPVLIVWGARDTLIPVAHGERAHEALPGSRLEVFERSGHMPQLEEPTRFTEALRSFVAETEPAEFDSERWRRLVARSVA